MIRGIQSALVKNIPDFLVFPGRLQAIYKAQRRPQKLEDWESSTRSLIWADTQCLKPYDVTPYGVITP